MNGPAPDEIHNLAPCVVRNTDPCQSSQSHFLRDVLRRQLGQNIVRRLDLLLQLRWLEDWEKQAITDVPTMLDHVAEYSARRAAVLGAEAVGLHLELLTLAVRVDRGFGAGGDGRHGDFCAGNNGVRGVRDAAS